MAASKNYVDNHNRKQNGLTAQFEKYKAFLVDLRERVLKEQFIDLQAMVKYHKLTALTISTIKKAVPIIKEIERKRKVGTRFEWIYEEELNPDSIYENEADKPKTNEVTNKLIQSIIDHNSQYSQAATERQKEKKKEKVNTKVTVVNKESFDGAKISHQINFLQNKMDKEEAARGYLRQDEKDMYPLIMDNLKILKTLKELL